MSSPSYHTLQAPLPSSSSLEAAVQVAVRIRPISQRENLLAAVPLCRLDPSDPQHSLILEPPSFRTNRRSLAPLYAEKECEVLRFTFDFCYDDERDRTEGLRSSSQCQGRIFDDIGSQIVTAAISGYNTSLLAYGQTSSGKTHSMMGSGPDSDGFGLIPRIASSLFHHVNSSPSSTPYGEAVFRKVECSYVEIYSEKIRDLLDPRKHRLRVRENPRTGPYIEGVSVCAVRDYDELERLMVGGNAERTIASTNMNAESSRSHAVFTIQLTQTTVDAASGLSSAVISKVQLVDLAGSERVEHSGATGLRLKEASTINKSLTTLGRVVAALAQRSEASGVRGSISGTMTRKSLSSRSKDESLFIPFRDSVLTWLLKESLGGNSRTFMLACISPADSNYEETVSTLRYASRAKNIVNRAVVNEDPNAELIRRLKAEVEQLKLRLAQQSSSPSSSSSPSPFLPSAIDYSLPTAHLTLREKDAELLRMNAHIAQLQAEATQSRVSMMEMEEQWQAKLRQARLLQEVRLREMQERGVSVKEEAELPFLVNLNEDPSLTESLIYHLHDGRTTIGSRKSKQAGREKEEEKVQQKEDGSSSSRSSDEEDDRPQAAGHGYEDDKRIVLSGLHVKADHCYITKHAAIGCVISPVPGVAAETHVNGSLLTEDRALVHGDRVVVGQQHFFRFSRSKAAIQQEREKEEQRRKKKEERQSRISVDTRRGSSTPPSEPPVYDFQYAQRELFAHGSEDEMVVGPVSRAAVNRSLNRSTYEDREPDSSPEPPRHMRSASAQSMLSPALPSSSPLLSPGSAHSPALASSTGRRSPSAVKATEEKEEDPPLRPPTFHLGRDVKGSVDWSSRRAVTKGEIEEWIKQDRRYLARHQQRLIDRARAACEKVMQPLGVYSAEEYRNCSHAVYKWRWHVVKRALREEIMRLVFLCDEANAITAALGRPERYKVELVSSQCLLPEMFLSQVPFTTQFSQPQSSPLQRLRGMKVVYCQVVEVRRRMLPIPVLSFDQFAFTEQLAVLRQHYNDMLEGPDDALSISKSSAAAAAASSASLSASSSSALSLTSSSLPTLLPLPSSDLYSHPQLLGRALCFLHGLRYGHSVKHSATVLDERGEVAGLLNVEMEIASVDEDVARRDIERDEKLRAKEEREEEARRKAREAALDRRDDDDDEELHLPSPSAASDDEQKTNTFLQAHRVLAVILRITSYDTQTRNLRRHGLHSVWVKYHVKDSTAAYRTRKLTIADDVSRYSLDYEHTHYFSGMDLQMLMDWLMYDAVIFELWCRVEDGNRRSVSASTGAAETVRKLSTPLPTFTPDAAIVGEDDDATTGGADGRRESLAKRMQSPLNRSASKENREVEKPITSRSVASSISRRPTVGGGGGGAAVGGGKGNVAGVEIENGNKVVDHLLFACVDIEEEAVGKKGQFVACSLKQDEDGRMVHRVTMHREKRLIISLLQADQRPFVLESLSTVSSTCLSLRSPASHTAIPLPSPIVFPIVEQFANVDHKLLVCTSQWNRQLDVHPFLCQPSAAGQRVNLTVRLECYFSKTSAPVQVTVELQMKVYKGGGEKGGGGGLFSKRSVPLNDPDRIARIGIHVSVTRQSSPQTVGNVYKEQEIILEQLQRRLRFEQRRQQQQLTTKLQHTTPHLLQELRDRHEKSADGLCKHFTLRFSRILADLRRRGGIRVEVEAVNSSTGIKCGYLNEKKSGGGPGSRSESYEPKWCVLKPPYLFVYGRKGESREQGIVKLMKAEYSRVEGDGKDCSWLVKTASGAVWSLQAANEAEMRSWLKALGANLTALGLQEQTSQ